ncbi:MAG: DUF2799 domain-containing protein [Parvularculaceae bacterium]|nr:DUF2799 domain-containing protein [Parvularculaceae bacterium]
MSKELFSLVGAALVLAGCETFTATDCKNADWRKLGLEDGYSGKSSQVRRLTGICREVEIVPDDNLYECGRAEGLETYCTPLGVYKAANRRQGIRYNPDRCGGNTEFQEISEAIFNEKAAQRRWELAAGEASELNPSSIKSEIKSTKSALASLSEPGSDSTRQERMNYSWERGRLESKISSLESRLEEAEGPAGQRARTEAERAERERLQARWERDDMWAKFGLDFRTRNSSYPPKRRDAMTRACPAPEPAEPTLAVPGEPEETFEPLIP